MIRRFSILLLSALLLSPVASAATDKEKEEKAPSQFAPELEQLSSTAFKKEVKALNDAVYILEEVNDEKSAKAAIHKLTSLFKNLPPLLNGNGRDLEILARAQNRVSLHMWRLINEPFFQKLNMQETWSLITDPFSRPSATPGR